MTTDGQASSYLSIDELQVNGEDDVGAAALSWLHTCPCHYQSDIVTVLSSVRLEYLDDSYIRHRILNDQVGAITLAESSGSVM